jgi:predicted ester cyclase
MGFGVPVVAGLICEPDMVATAGDFDPVMTSSLAPSESAGKRPK